MEGLWRGHPSKIKHGSFNRWQQHQHERIGYGTRRAWCDAHEVAWLDLSRAH
jgi:hypothetical protein